MSSPKLCVRIAGLALLTGLLAWGVSGAATWEQSRWRGAVYYRATFDPDMTADALLHVAAVDSYEVYFNGTLVGTDSVWTRMSGYEVAVKDGRNEIAVKVVNRGRGVGSGLLVAVAAADTLVDGFLAETTTNPRVLPWYWTAELQEGTDWTKVNVARNDAWNRVQEGHVEYRSIAGLVDTVLTVVAGFPGGIDAGGVAGGLVLRSVRGENLALNRPSNRTEVVDGDLNSSWEPQTNAVNFFASIDLQGRRRVHAMRAITRGVRETDLEANSLRGYSVQVSDDQIRWSEVGILHDITQYAWSEVRFPPIWTRHARLVIVDIDPTTSPKIAEVEVLGDGYAEEGVFLSEPLDLESPDAVKNFGRVRWEAVVPERTELALQFRTGDSPADFADAEPGWSAPMADDAGWFPASEPGRYLQYRVHMVSLDGRSTPEFQGLQLDYSAAIAASGARGRVAPNRVPMGVETAFTYFLDLDFAAGDLGIERLRIRVPGPARLDADAAVHDLLAGWSSTQGALTLNFAEPLRDVSTLEVPFRTRSHASLHVFRAYLFSPGSDNPLNVAEDRGEAAYSWSVAVTTSAANALSEVRARPPVFTPNGDGVNDFTVIEFAIAKVAIPRAVEIRIFDLSGVEMRRLQTELLGAGAYGRAEDDGDERSSPGYWDGRDEEGALVPPGIYLYQVEIGLDAGDEVRRGVVSVVY